MYGLCYIYSGHVQVLTVHNVPLNASVLYPVLCLLPVSTHHFHPERPCRLHIVIATSLQAGLVTRERVCRVTILTIYYGGRGEMILGTTLISCKPRK